MKVGNSGRTIMEGNLNKAVNKLVFTHSQEFTYEGTIAMDKSVSGTAQKSMVTLDFTMHYVPPNRN